MWTLGLLLHPGGDIEGIATVAMVPSVVLVIAYGLGRVATLPPWGQRLFFAGVLAEFSVTWALLLSLVYQMPPFAGDANHQLKQDHRLTFVYDLAGGQWVPFAAIALLAQAIAVVCVLRMLSRTATQGDPEVAL